MGGMMYVYIAIAVIIVGLAIFFLVRELKYPKKKMTEGSDVVESKRRIEKAVQNLESMVELVKTNEKLKNKLSSLKEIIRFLNPVKNEKIKVIDEKILARLDDMKIEISKDENSETIWRMIEEVEGYIAQRTKEA
ncbi:MAG TPA: hypothetical protein IAC38_01315 [Candidatus Caccovivens faecavium]|nr:hypothetical protein [Candidatus Caccovivens faecavium]